MRIELIRLPAAAIHALGAGDLAAANEVSPVPLPPFFVEPEQLRSWQRRSEQIEADPDSEQWIARVIWDPELKVAVGRAGFHGPPDQAGMVEIGYAVDPAYRRRGYAAAAFQLLLERAVREPGVRVLRATIRPDNFASLRVIASAGMIEVGEQWDDEDGLEIIYEVDV